MKLPACAAIFFSVPSLVSTLINEVQLSTNRCPFTGRPSAKTVIPTKLASNSLIKEFHSVNRAAALHKVVNNQDIRPS